MLSNTKGVTLLCKRIADGDDDAQDQLITLVYFELREIARGLLRRGVRRHSLQATDLVNAAYPKLVAGKGGAFKQDRAFFFGAVARAMRQILADRARKSRHLPLCRIGDDIPDRQEGEDKQLAALDEALEELARYAPRPAKVVELRFFVGLTVNSVADELGVAPATVERDFRVARAFLKSRIMDWMEQ